MKKHKSIFSANTPFNRIKQKKMLEDISFTLVQANKHPTLSYWLSTLSITSKNFYKREQHIGIA